MTKRLPALQANSRLQLEIATLQPILCAVHASVDREAFSGRYEANKAAIKADMDLLAREYVSASRMLSIRSAVSEISALAEDPEATLGVYGADEQVDRDRARKLPAHVSESGRPVKDRLDVEADCVRKAVSKGGRQTNEFLTWH